MCAVLESKKKIYSSHRLKNHFFLSLSLRASVSLPNHSALIHSPKSLSVCASLSLPNHSSSPKSPIIKLSFFRPSHPKAPNHSPSLLSHRHALSLISHSSVDWVWLWDRIDGVWLFCGCAPVGFRGCAPVGFCGCTPVNFVVVLRWVFVVVLRWVSWLWDRICGLVGWWCCGLWWGDGRCGFVVVIAWVYGGGAGIMEVWLWVWDCGGGLCCGFASDEREEESREKEKNK